jgi:hypothetical protein
MARSNYDICFCYESSRAMKSKTGRSKKFPIYSKRNDSILCYYWFLLASSKLCHFVTQHHVFFFFYIRSLRIAYHQYEVQQKVLMLISILNNATIAWQKVKKYFYHKHVVKYFGLFEKGETYTFLKRKLNSIANL